MKLADQDIEAPVKGMSLNELRKLQKRNTRIANAKMNVIKNREGREE